MGANISIVLDFHRRLDQIDSNECDELQNAAQEYLLSRHRLLLSSNHLLDHRRVQKASTWWAKASVGALLAPGN